MQQLANLAQSTFGVELTELNFYDGEGTLNTSLMDTVLTDVKGGTIMEGEGAGDMFIDGTDGADKYDMNNTLGHEVIESVTALTGGTNDAAQEDQATAFGSHFADRVDQAFEGGINTTSTGAFTTSLANSNAVNTGTNAANSVSGANIDNRMIHTRETEIINQRLAPDYVEYQARRGNIITEEEAAELLSNQLLRRVNGEAQTSGDARENWDHEADRYLSAASRNDFLRDENGEIIYDRHGSITPLFGTNSIYQKMDDTIFAPNESELPLMEQPDLGVREMADYSIGRVTGAVKGLGDIAQGSIDFLKDPAGGVTNIIDGVTNLPESLENQADDYFQAVIENDWRAVGEMEGNYDSGMLLDVTGAAGTGKILGLLDETSVAPVPLKAVDEAPNNAEENVVWVDENATMSDRARNYDDSATGSRSNIETQNSQAPTIQRTMEDGTTRPVKFDGFDGEVLIDRKISVVTTPKAKDQVLRQSQALSENGVTGRWEVPTEAQAKRAQKMFDELGVKNIEVQVVPEQ